MMLASAVRSVSRGFNVALQLATRRGFALAPSATPVLLAAPLRYTATPLHHIPPRRYTVAVRWPSTPKPNPTPWQWRIHPSWARQLPLAGHSPRSAMAGLASVPSATALRAAGFALGGVDDFDPVPEASVATPVPTADDSNPILTPEATTPVLSQAQRALLPTATDDFREIREQKLLFVDKSGFLSELARDSTKASLITRPRRSGKTTAMKMAACFLDQRCRDQSAEWFEGLSVMDDPEAVGHMWKYPVIFLDLKSAGASSYDEFLVALAEQMLLIYRSFPECDADISQHEYRRTIEILESIADNGMPSSPTQASAWERRLKGSLANLTRIIEASTGQRSWVIVDEYDAPIQEAYSSEMPFHTQTIAFMKHFLGGALKGNPHLHKAVMTGVMRVAIASLFSGVNNVKVRSVLDRQYSQHFGFTESEVKWLLGKFDHSADMAEVRRWYNGYTVGGHMLYNPVSIVDYIDNGFEAEPYWVGTGQEGHGLLASRMQELVTLHHGRGLRALRGLMTPNLDKEGYRSVMLAINPVATYEPSKTICDDIWSLMLQSGYLTSRGKVKVGIGLDQETKYQLAIPNQEVSQVFKQIVRMWFDRDFGVDAELSKSILSLLKQDKLENILLMLQSHLRDVSSVYDFSKRMQYEESYHIAMLFMSVMLQNVYLIESNREMGTGRADIVLTPKEPQQKLVLDHTRRGIVVELKLSDRAEALQSGVDEALRQIVTKDYAAKLRRDGIERVAHIGLAFHGSQMAFGVERYTLDRARNTYVLEESELSVVGDHTAKVERERLDDKSQGQGK